MGEDRDSGEVPFSYRREILTPKGEFAVTASRECFSGSLFCFLAAAATCFIPVVVGAENPAEAGPANALTDEEKAAGFELLFAGKSLDGWQQSGNWEVVDGAIFRARKEGSLTWAAKTVPDDFELRFEWKVAQGSNSGVYYRPGQYEYQTVGNSVHAAGAVEGLGFGGAGLAARPCPVFVQEHGDPLWYRSRRFSNHQADDVLDQ